MKTRIQIHVAGGGGLDDDRTRKTAKLFRDFDGLIPLISGPVTGGYVNVGIAVRGRELAPRVVQTEFHTRSSCLAIHTAEIQLVRDDFDQVVKQLQAQGFHKSENSNT